MTAPVTTTAPHRFSEDLNYSQYSAVTHPGGPLLVLAGPGTGKTRVLTYRVAWLLDQGVPASAILMATFSCSAAEEMLKRSLFLAGCFLRRDRKLRGGTFHSIACGFLRQYGSHIGLSSKFVIIDRQEAEGVIAYLRTLYAAKKLPQKGEILDVISAAANRMAPVEDFSLRISAPQGFIPSIARKYAAHKAANSLLDFDDLLLQFHRLLTESETAREKIVSQFQHILVDEYQDTNRVQAEIVKMLAPHGNVTVVGDEAQAIYSFRGADSESILRFPQDFPGCTVCSLRHNYRSTKRNVAFTNAIIEGKNLYTDNSEGEFPLLFHAFNEADEARFVADQICHLLEDGCKPSDIAVLFRSDRYAAKLEMELAGRDIPFRKRGGRKKISETAQVKDVLAFFRILVNPHDRLAWMRIFLQLDNVGDVTASKLVDSVLAADQPLAALHEIAPEPKWQQGFTRLSALLDSIRNLTRPCDVVEQVMPYMYPFYARKNADDAVKQERGLDQLAHLIRGYHDMQMLVDSLSCDPADEEPEDGAVSMFTVHAAKCREWRAVFLIGLAQGIFPSYLVTPEEMPEERRVFYVAATRAKELLFLSYPGRFSSSNWQASQAEMSPFLQGIEPNLYETAMVLPF